MPPDVRAHEHPASLAARRANGGVMARGADELDRGWSSSSTRYRDAFEAAVGRVRESEQTRADLLAVFLDLDDR